METTTPFLTSAQYSLQNIYSVTSHILFRSSPSNLTAFPALSFFFNIFMLKTLIPSFQTWWQPQYFFLLSRWANLQLTVSNSCTLHSFQLAYLHLQHTYTIGSNSLYFSLCPPHLNYVLNFSKFFNRNFPWFFIPFLFCYMNESPHFSIYTFITSVQVCLQQKLV